MATTILSDKIDSFVKRKQFIFDVATSPCNTILAVLSYYIDTNTYEISFSFPEISFVSIKDTYAWKAKTTPEPNSPTNSVDRLRRGSHLQWNLYGNRLLVHINNSLQIFSLTWFDKLSNQKIVSSLSDLRFLLRLHGEDTNGSQSTNYGNVNDLFSLQLTVKANHVSLPGVFVAEINDQTVSVVGSTGFTLLDWDGKILRRFSLFPLLVPERLSEESNGFSSETDFFNLFRFQEILSPVPYINGYTNLCESNSDFTVSGPSEGSRSEIRELHWLEALQSFFISFVDGSFAFYSSNRRISSMSSLFLNASKAMTPAKGKRTAAGQMTPATPAEAQTSRSQDKRFEGVVGKDPFDEFLNEANTFILSQRIYFISQVAYPLRQSIEGRAGLPKVYECSAEGLYSSPYVTLREVRQHLNLTPSLEKKISKSSLLINARNVEEISKVLDVVVLEDSVDVANESVEVLALVSTRHFMEGYELQEAVSEETEDKRSGLHPQSKEVSGNQFVTTYSLARLSIFRRLVGDAAADTPALDPNVITTAPTGNPTSVSTPVKKLSVAVPLVLPELSVKLSEMWNISSSETSELDRGVSKLIVQLDPVNQESYVITMVRNTISCRPLRSLSAALYAVDLSASISPGRQLSLAVHADTTSSGEEETLLSRSFLFTANSLLVLQSFAVKIAAVEGEGLPPIHTRFLRYPLLPSFYQRHLPQDENSSHRHVLFNSSQNSLQIHRPDHHLPSIHYYDADVLSAGAMLGQSDDQTSEKSSFITSQNAVQEDAIPLPRQLTAALQSYEAFASSLAFLQIHNLQGSMDKRFLLSKLNAFCQHPVSSLLLSMSSRRNCVFVNPPASSTSFCKRFREFDLGGEVDYIACVIGRKRSLSSYSQQVFPALASHHYCQVPELWIFNTATKRWRNTTLLVGIKESKAKFIKNIPAIDYHLIITEDDDVGSIQSDSNMIRRGLASENSSPVKHSSPVHRGPTLSRSMSVGLEHPSFYLSGTASMEKDEDALRGLLPEGSRPQATEPTDKTLVRVPSLQVNHEETAKDVLSDQFEGLTKPPIKRLEKKAAIPQPPLFTRRRSDSDTSKSSDITDITMSTFSAMNPSLPAPNLSLPPAIRRVSKPILRASLETTVTTPLASSSLPSGGNASQQIHNNNQFIVNLLQIISIAWFDNHTIVLLTLRKSIYYIEIISREILKDVYFHPTSLPTTLANAMAAGATAAGTGFANSYCVQPKLHKLIPLPIGFIPTYFDLVNIVSPADDSLPGRSSHQNSHNPPPPPAGSRVHSTSQDRGEGPRAFSSDSAAPQMKKSSGVLPFLTISTGTTAPRQGEDQDGWQQHYYAVVIVSDGKNFIAYQVNARSVPQSVSVGEHGATQKTNTTSDLLKAIENYSFVELWNFTLEDLAVPAGLSPRLDFVQGKTFTVFKGFLQQFPVNEKQVIVFDNLQKNYGPGHNIHYVSLIVATDAHDYFMIDGPLRSFVSLQASPSSSLLSPFPEPVSIRVLSARHFPLASGLPAGGLGHGPHYCFNDLVAVQFTDLSADILKAQRNDLLRKLFSFQLLRKFGKTEELRAANEVSGLLAERRKDYFWATGYNVSLSFESFVNYHYLLAPHEYHEEFVKSIVKLILPLPLTSFTAVQWMRKDLAPQSAADQQSSDAPDDPEQTAMHLRQVLSPAIQSIDQGQLVTFLHRGTSAASLPFPSSSSSSRSALGARSAAGPTYSFFQESLTFQLFVLLFHEWKLHLQDQLLPSHQSLPPDEIFPHRLAVEYCNSPASHLHHQRRRALSAEELQSLKQLLQQQLAAFFANRFGFLQLFLYSAELLFQEIALRSFQRPADAKTAPGDSGKRKKPPRGQAALALREYEYFVFSSFFHEVNPVLYFEILTKLVRKLEPSVSRRLFPVATQFSLVPSPADSDGAAVSLQLRFLSSFEVLESQFLARSLVCYQTRFLSHFCDSIGGLESHTNILICIFYILEVAHQSITTLSLARMFECFEFCFRFEEILRGYCQQLRQDARPSVTLEQLAAENTKELVLARVEVMKKFSRQKSQKLALFLVGSLRKKLEDLEEVLSAKASEAAAPAVDGNGGAGGGGLWTGVSWFLSTIGLGSAETTSPTPSPAPESLKSRALRWDPPSSDPLPLPTTEPTAEGTRFQAIELIEELVSLGPLNQLLGQAAASPAPSPPPSLPLFLLSGVLRNWLVVRQKKYFHTAAYLLVALVARPKFLALLRGHLDGLLFVGPWRLHGLAEVCARPLVPAGGLEASSGELAERLETVHAVLIVFRVQRHLRRVRGPNPPPEQLAGLLSFLLEGLSEQYLRKLIDLEYNNYSFYASHSSHGPPAPPAQAPAQAQVAAGRTNSLDQSSHSQSHSLRYRYYPSHHQEMAGQASAASSALLSPTSFQNKYFPIYFDSLADDDDLGDDGLPKAVPPQEERENLFFHAQVWADYLKERRRRPLDGATVSSFDMLRGIVCAFLASGELVVPLLLLYEVRRVLCEEVQELLEVLVEKDAAEQSLTAEERTLLLRQLFVEFLFAS